MLGDQEQVAARARLRLRHPSSPSSFGLSFFCMSSSEVANLSRLSVSQSSVKELSTASCDEFYVNGPSQVFVVSAGLLVRCDAGGDEHTCLVSRSFIILF